METTEEKIKEIIQQYPKTDDCKFETLKELWDWQEGQVIDLINQAKEECAKEAGENFDMDLYEKFCEENRGRFHSGHFSERETVMEFISEAIERIK